MNLRKLVFVGTLFLLMLYIYGCGNSSVEQTPSEQSSVEQTPAEQTSAEQANATTEKQIQISNVKITPVSSSDCEIKLSLLATYINIKTGAEPNLWWHISGGERTSLGFTPLSDIEPNQKQIKISNIELKLAATSRCSGTCNIFLWIEDNDIRSNKIEESCTFK